MNQEELIQELKEFLFDYHQRYNIVNISLLEHISNGHLKICDRDLILDNIKIGYLLPRFITGKQTEALDFLIFITDVNNENEDLLLDEFLKKYIFKKYWNEIEPLIPHIIDIMGFELS